MVTSWGSRTEIEQTYNLTGGSVKLEIPIDNKLHGQANYKI